MSQTEKGRPLSAHTPPSGSDQWHDLEDHLTSVAERAGMFARRFGAEDLARFAGLLHDVGKANPRFQRYLEKAHDGQPGESVPHAIWGAAIASRILARKGWEIAGLPVAGHHGGLRAPGVVKQEIEAAIEGDVDLFSELFQRFAELPHPEEVDTRAVDPLERELRTRFILSALVDADHLDTEAHFDPGRASKRGNWPTVGDLWDRFKADQERLVEGAPDTPINEIRDDIYEACVEEADKEQGVFRLTVPTGGGKTRSGMAFALRHALEHDLRRVVVGIPYTSIIEQNAEVYRSIFGPDAVLEDHSRVDLDGTEDQDRASVRLRLSRKNWEAPIVVTTTVQLLESLFSNRPAGVRKLHRLSDSVIVLDEVQTIPPKLAEPTFDVLRALVEDYGVTLVLSTATQPALEDDTVLQAFPSQEVRQIVPGYDDHFEALRRVRYERRTDQLSWPALADEIAEEDQVLVVVNARKDALDLLRALPTTETVFHLSTLLCPEHRRDTLTEIHHRLDEDEPVRVVSTQVVEAGVDIDFPVVYRALGPLDRIVQAAGRCNREGRLDQGRVVVFEPADGRSPGGPYRTGMGQARAILREREPEDLHEPDIFRDYFARVYELTDLDAHDIQSLRRKLRYRKVAEQYQLIRDDTTSVVVDYRDQGHGLAHRWRDQPSRRSWLRVQPYVVSVYDHELERYDQQGWTRPLTENVHLWTGKYDELYGLTPELHDPHDLIR